MRGLLLCLLLACSNNSTSTQAPAPTPQTDPPKPEPTAGPKLHEKCGEGDACGEGACVTYYGIAGPRGPEFKTCEIRCDDQTKCPAGTSCGVIADGPGQVCR